MKGRHLTRLLVASLYAAFREMGVPKSLDEVAAACGADRKAVARCYRLLVRELNMEIPVADSAEYVATLASRARMSAHVQVRALEMLHRAEKAGVTAGMDPMGLTASALYMAAALEGQKLTQRTAAEAAGVTEVTIRNQIRRLSPVLGVP